MECHDRQHVDDQAHLGQGDQDDQVHLGHIIVVVDWVDHNCLFLSFFPNKHSPHRKEKLRVEGLELGPKQRVERLDTRNRSILSRKERFKVLQLWYHPK